MGAAWAPTPLLFRNGAYDVPVRVQHIAVMPVEQGFEAAFNNGVEKVFQFAAVHADAAMVQSHPGANAAYVRDTFSHFCDFAQGDLLEEFRWERCIQISQAFGTGDVEGKEFADPVECIFFCEAGVPGAEGFYVAVEGAFEAVDSVLPEVELGALEIYDV